MTHTIAANELSERVAHLFERAGTQTASARQVADNLVMANLSGHDSHGVGMAPRYVDAILEGNLKPDASIKVQTDSGCLLGIQGQAGLGQVVGVQAMELALQRTAEQGACVMALAHAHHLGRIGHFAEMAVARGYVSLHFVSVFARPVVAPFGGTDGRFGTNPCCIGIPLGYGDTAREPFVLDFATSRVAQGKMRVAHNEGRQVAPGTLIDEHGQPTNNPGVVVVPQSNGRMGALLPFGEYKGFGLSVVCELLGGALTGGGTWHQEPDARRAVFNSMFSIIVDPQRLGTQQSFASETLAFIDWMQQSPVANTGTGTGAEGVLLAGDPERRARETRGREGIAIDEATWQELLASAQKVNHVF